MIVESTLEEEEYTVAIYKNENTGCKLQTT